MSKFKTFAAAQAAEKTPPGAVIVSLPFAAAQAAEKTNAPNQKQ